MTEAEIIFNNGDMTEEEAIKFVKEYGELAHKRSQQLLSDMQENGHAK